MPRINLSKIQISVDAADFTPELMEAFVGGDRTSDLPPPPSHNPAGDYQPPHQQYSEAHLLPPPPRLLMPAPPIAPVPSNPPPSPAIAPPPTWADAVTVDSATVPPTAPTQLPTPTAQSPGLVSAIAGGVMAGAGGAVRLVFVTLMALIRLGGKLHPLAWAVVWIGLSIGIVAALLRSHEVVNETPEIAPATVHQPEAEPTPEAPPPPQEQEELPPPPELAPPGERFMPPIPAIGE